MNIAVIGSEASVRECTARLGDSHRYQMVNFLTDAKEVDLIFDFTDEWPDEKLNTYSKLTTRAFVNSVYITLGELNNKVKFKTSVFGFCGWPGFFNRAPLEVSLLDASNKSLLNALAGRLNLQTIIVNDQVGMIAPRVVAMIINEAFETLQQGVASREDIDLSMKLGTNYPYGPFEWADKIGVNNVRRLLLSLEKVTKDSRFSAKF